MTLNSTSNIIHTVELLTKNTLDKKLAGKENTLISGSSNVTIDRETEPGKTIIKVAGASEDIVLSPDTTVMVDGEKKTLSKYIEDTSIDKVKIVNLEEGETQKDAVSRVLNELRYENTPESTRRGLIFIQRKQGETDIDIEGTYDFYTLVRPDVKKPATWRLKRIGSDIIENPIFENGATAGTETVEANFKSYVKPIDSDTNVLVGAVRNIDNLIDTPDKETSVYNNKDCISVTRINKLADILYINEQTE